MITEVRVIGTGKILWEGELPEGGRIEVHDGVQVEWISTYKGGCSSYGKYWITLKEPAKVTLVGRCLEIEKLPPEPELPDRLEPVRNYLHRDWEIGWKNDIGAEVWSIATVYGGISADGVGMDEMVKGNRSLIKNAPRTYEAMIALYNLYMENCYDPKADELDVVQSVAALAKEIQGECE